MKIIKIIISILIAESAGLIGSVFTAQAIPTWYAGINKPAFTPPGWLFGPVWILLYASMGYASYLVWQARETEGVSKPALIIYLIHLFFNALWSFLFFGLKNPGLAFFEIIILWTLIVIVMLLFFRINRLSGSLMIPYLAWVSFASILSFAIWRLN